MGLPAADHIDDAVVTAVVGGTHHSLRLPFLPRRCGLSRGVWLAVAPLTGPGPCSRFIRMPGRRSAKQLLGRPLKHSFAFTQTTPPLKDSCTPHLPLYCSVNLFATDFFR